MGCDYGIDSNAVEDRCGVCLGDGSSCETVYKTFDGGEGFGEFFVQRDAKNLQTSSNNLRNVVR